MPHRAAQVYRCGYGRNVWPTCTLHEHIDQLLTELTFRDPIFNCSAVLLLCRELPEQTIEQHAGAFIQFISEDSISNGTMDSALSVLATLPPVALNQWSPACLQAAVHTKILRWSD